LSDLSPKAEDLVGAARAALQPSEADRQRVLEALMPQIGGTPDAGVPAASSATAAVRGVVMKALAVLAGLGVVGGVSFFVLRPQPRPAAPIIEPPAAPAPALTPVIVEPQRELDLPQAPAVKKTRTVPRSADSLAQEVAILSRASTELHAGRPAAALAALADHQNKFPNGVLIEERRAARVQALCALGRNQEAKAELVQLARIAPNSPHAARVRKACGFDGAEGE
jgi:hypothetical protein